METQKDKLMRILNCTEEEAVDIIAYDKEVDRNQPTEYDLTDEQQKNVKQYLKCDKKVTAYKFTKRERKENVTKSSIIEEIATFLPQIASNLCEDVTIVNKERQIAFKIGENCYELTLVQKRTPKN